MQLHDIQAFIAAVEYQNISKAAEALYISQTALTHRLQNLENELGVTLIDRGRGFRQLTLTNSGEEFLTIARRWEAVQEETEKFKYEGEQLSLSIGAVHMLNEFIFPPLFAKLIQHVPKIKLTIHSEHSMKLFTLVEQRQADVGFAWRDIVHNNLVSKPWKKAPLVVLYSGDPQEAGKTVIKNEDLDIKKEIVIIWSPEYNVWHEHNWPIKFNPRFLRIVGAPMLMTLMKDTDLWSIVPLWLAKYAINQGSFTYSFLANPPEDLTCYSITHRYPRASTKRSLKVFFDYLDKFQFDQDFK